MRFLLVNDTGTNHRAERVPPPSLRVMTDQHQRVDAFGAGAPTLSRVA